MLHLGHNGGRHLAQLHVQPVDSLEPAMVADIVWPALHIAQPLGAVLHQQFADNVASDRIHRTVTRKVELAGQNLLVDLHRIVVVERGTLAWSGASAQESHEALRGLIRKAISGLDAVDRLVEERRNSSEVNGLRASFYDRYVDIMVPRFDIPPADQAEIKEKVFDQIKEAEPGKWFEHKMLFNPASDPENTKYICVYGFVRNDGNFDLVVLELARDVLVIQNKRTGEISLERERSWRAERLPGEVDEQDVQVVLKFFEATALRILSKKDLSVFGERLAAKLQAPNTQKRSASHSMPITQEPLRLGIERFLLQLPLSEPAGSSACNRCVSASPPPLPALVHQRSPRYSGVPHIV
uniref:NERD domain-containing protein n=1 Tax=Macrostomum lignano TaxID=282301 RepID=A0A1I8HHY5_9PLAT